MKKILLDTNAYVAFKRGLPEAVAIVRLADRIGMSVVVVGELLAGFGGGSHEKRNRRELSEFLSSPRVELVPVADQTPEYYCLVFQALRRRGKPVPTNDLWIAASALEHGYAVYTYDRHFSAVEGIVCGSSEEAFLP